MNWRKQSSVRGFRQPSCGGAQLWDSKGQWPHVASEAGWRQNYAMCSNARAQGGRLTPSALRPP